MWFYLIKQLQHDGEHIGVGFVHLVKEYHSIWALPQLFGELSTLFMAHIAGWRADEFCHLGGRNRKGEG